MTDGVSNRSKSSQPGGGQSAKLEGDGNGERLTATSSKGVQNAFAAATWLAGLCIPLLPYVTAQATGQLVPWSLEALYLPLSVVAWYLFYLSISRAMQAVGGPFFMDDFAGYPAWSYWVSVVHGVVMLTTLFGVGTYLRAQEGGVGVHELDVRADVLDAPWDTSRWSAIAWQQIDCAVIGYLLKDFNLYADGLETAYLAHHLVASTGCALSLVFPYGAGIVAMNAAQCELASAIFGLSVVRANLVTEVLYVVGMTVSNVVTTWVAHDIFMKPEVDNAWRYCFAFISLLLLVLRAGGVALFFLNKCSRTSAKAKPE